MSLVQKFKQSDVSSSALMIAAGASVAVIVLSYRINRMEKEVTQMRELSDLHTAVSLKLIDQVGRMTVRSESQ